VPEACLLCGRPFASKWEPKRICWKCKLPIRKGHKWSITEDQRVAHRNCKEPDSYKIEEV
jgi:hypothetical protein